MGGGRQEAPKTYSPQEQAQAQIQIDNASSQREAQAAAREKAAKAAQDAVDLRNNQAALGTRYNAGKNYGQQQEASLGFNDTYGLLDSFNKMLQTAYQGADPRTANPNTALNYEDLWNDARTTTEGAQKTKLDNQFRGLTKPGWENDFFADTSDDSILDEILGNQYGEAKGTLDSARDRGQLSQGAYDNSLRGLDTKKMGARSTLEDMGLGVLGGYRKNLDDISDTWGDQVTGYKLGQDVNLDDYTGSLNAKAGDLRNRLSGDIYRAVGDTSLFNTDSLMARGNASAGASNTPLKAAFLSNGQPVVDPERTTGTAGVF